MMFSQTLRRRSLVIGIIALILALFAGLLASHSTAATWGWPPGPKPQPAKPKVALLDTLCPEHSTGQLRLNRYGHCDNLIDVRAEAPVNTCYANRHWRVTYDGCAPGETLLVLPASVPAKACASGTRNHLRHVHSLAECRAWETPASESGRILVSDEWFRLERVQKFFADGEFITKWGDPGTGNGQFDDPRGLATDARGNIYVADTANDRIQVFDPNGVFIKTWGSDGTGNGQFKNPTDIAIDRQGNSYVADFGNDRIQVFDRWGNFLFKWGSFGTGDGEFDSPYAIAFDANGDVYVAERDNNRVQVFDRWGNFLRTWGTFGTGNGQFDRPRGIAVDRYGQVYVSDSDNDRVQVFRTNGSFLRTWGSQGSGNGQFVDPRHIDVDLWGRVYVVDRRNDRVQVFDSDGNFLFKWGSDGDGDGQFRTGSGLAVMN